MSSSSSWVSDFGKANTKQEEERRNYCCHRDDDDDVRFGPNPSWWWEEIDEDDCGGDDDGGDGESVCLDESGFPLVDGNCEGVQQQSIESAGDNKDKSSSGTFASEFYRAGTDWSCLLTPPPPPPVNEGDDDKNSRTKRRKLKQVNLFESWGLAPKNTTIINPNPISSSIKRSKGRGGHHQLHNVTTQGRPRVCPFYKKIPGTTFTVDAFRYGLIKGCSAYFLTHFHADHYGGLNKQWSHGPIYCTTLTARLVKMCLYVDQTFLHPLELDTEYEIEGTKVTMLEANHCPGAALIHFRAQNGQCYLHTGDFRSSKQMHDHPLLSRQNINVLYLDTTYCNPKYRFPAREAVLDFVVKVAESYLKKQPKTLVIVGAYSIGKECVYLAIAKALRVKICVSPSRKRILQSFDWPEISGNLCTNGNDTPLHVLPLSHIKIQSLQKYLKAYMNHYKAVLAFRPTGWAYSDTFGCHLDLIKPSSKGAVTIYGVPYSEHSSFPELKDFVQILRPEKIIPTVNIGNAFARDRMQSYFREWLFAS